VTWRTTLIGLTVTPTHTSAAVRCSDGTTHTISARWVVGAVMACSAVRHALGIDFNGSTCSHTGLLADVELGVPTQEHVPTGTLRLNLTSGGFVGIFGLGNGRLFGAVPPGGCALPPQVQLGSPSVCRSRAERPRCIRGPELRSRLCQHEPTPPTSI
jgi:2-polyprenyl-6-methoxyphenol hydroxylase-like FAD-dependent oxidoreductase